MKIFSGKPYNRTLPIPFILKVKNAKGGENLPVPSENEGNLGQKMSDIREVDENNPICPIYRGTGQFQARLNGRFQPQKRLKHPQNDIILGTKTHEF